MTTNSKRGIAISSSWVLIIVTPLLGIVLWVAINYANQQRDDALHASLVRQYEGSVKACKRGNIVRLAVRANSHIIIEFLTAARIARIAAVKTATNATDRKLNANAAKTYTRLLASTRPVHLVDCLKAYVHP
jgi:hypothetical protein